MDYDIERSKRESTNIRNVFRELFPLAGEEDLPCGPAHIKGFLRDRIKLEVDERVHHFQSRVCRIICEVSPPKSRIEDMCRIVVEEAKEAKRCAETVKARDEEHAKVIAILNGFKGAMKAVAKLIGSDGMDACRDDVAKVVADLKAKLSEDSKS